MAELFRRSYELVVHDQRITELDITFRVERTLRRTANKATFTVYNLSPDNRRRLEQLERVGVQLRAGYESGLSTLFRGRLRKAQSARDGVDWVTTIEAADGLKEARAARGAVSFAAGTDPRDVLERVADLLGVGRGNVRSAVGQAVIRRLLDSGAVIDGPVVEELERLTRSLGLEWSIQGEELQVLARGRALQGTAIRLAPETGLVGVPAVGSKGKVSCRALLIPDLFPGRRVRVESEVVGGLYRVNAASYSGSSFGVEWYADLELKAEASG